MSELSLNIPIQNEQPIHTLYQVSLQGDVAAFKRLLQEDALVLDRFTSFDETPLHIAAMRGHFDFARALLHHKPDLSQDLDSLHRLPLHWASEKGYLNIVKELLKKSPDRACLWRDQDGRIPLHLAAMKGSIDVVKELIRARPESIREKVENGGTILHLCVRYNRLDALKLLVDSTQGHRLVNEKDDHGNNILHLAAIFKQVEVTKYLLSEINNLDANESNMNGFTTLDVVEHSPIDSKALEIKIMLLEAGVKKIIQKPLCSSNNPVPSSTWTRFYKWWHTHVENIGNRLENARGNILVAATVTASMAFQAGISPSENVMKNADVTAPPPISYDYPLYTWLDFLFDNPRTDFWYYNTFSLMISLGIIMVMLSGIPFRNMFSSFVLVIAMQLIVIFTALTYLYAHVSSVNGSDFFNVVLVIALCSNFLIPFVGILFMFIHTCTFLLTFVMSRSSLFKTRIH
ncbi:ankyrin repeat-containing protein BDA1-like [Euphorbia lathyris]|uniref:ankyrin repeat-containing protein BDA1-like n=1 Tax=Euphorbia lathyris TaxID=212925 RepID=UPI0033131028